MPFMNLTCDHSLMRFYARQPGAGSYTQSHLHFCKSSVQRLMQTTFPRNEDSLLTVVNLLYSRDCHPHTFQISELAAAHTQHSSPHRLLPPVHGEKTYIRRSKAVETPSRRMNNSRLDDNH